MKNLSNFSIKRPKFTIVVMLVLLILGGVSLTRLPIQMMPEIEPPVAVVATSYPGAGPEEVLDSVTEPLEEDLSTVTGLQNISSQSQEASSLVILEFDYDMTIDEVENEITRTISSTNLPEQAEEPSFIEFDISMMPSIQMAATSTNGDTAEFENQVNDLANELESIQGVASININGLMEREVAVELDTEALSDYNLSQSDIAGMIEANNISMPINTIEDTEQGYNISTRTMNELDGLDELRELVLLDMPDEEVTLNDVADISISEDNGGVITRFNEEDAVQLEMMLADGANASSVNAEFNEELDALLDDEEYEQLSVSTLYDEGEYIDMAIDSIYVSLISGAVLAMFVLFAFIRNLKAPLIIGLSIPFSVITTFALLFFTNISINMMTLGGLALGIGMLLDNSIVVIENIYRHLSMGKNPKQAAREGTREVVTAILASTLTTASVFLPVVFVTGLVGQLFTPLAITVVFSLLASLFVAVTVVPMLASRILTVPKNMDETKRKQKGYMKRLRKATAWSLRHRASVLFAAVILFLAGAFGLAVQGMEFMPEQDEGFLTIEVEKEQGTLLEDTLATVEDIEAELDNHEEVDAYLSTAGSSGMMSFADESNTATISVQLTDASNRNMTTSEFINEVEDDIQDTDASAEINVIPMSQAGAGEPNTVVLNVSDNDEERLDEAETDIINELEDEADINSVTSSNSGTVEELQVVVDKAEARENGFQPAQVGEALYEATNGVEASTIEESGGYTTINVKYPADVLESEEAFENISIPNDEGEYIDLGDIASLEEAESPTLINRDEMTDTRELTVSFSDSLSLNEASQLIDDVITDLDLHEDTEHSMGGDMEMLNDAIPQLILAIALGIVFIYLVMVAQFESFKAPFAVIMTIPLAFIGVALSLLITNNPLSVIAMVGIILLIGIVVNNAILIVDYIQQQKEKGMSAYEAIEISVQDRFRPILITAVTTILGMLPLTLEIGEGMEGIAPMGIVVIGGLTASTFLTLFIIPIIYSFIDPETRKMNKKYMTPDGEIITQRQVDERKEQEAAASYEQSEQEADDSPEENTGSEQK
ncbi:multidrug ABC transporter [Oceanobacillus oncorhynchi subsp. incaldanensis]|uniref:Efflux RND transporter permease subunit n=1 Tax=Oceanobacillus aidingensis TaxID=645964 RepID=A0ABV9JXP2_9BACI|nr:efflux RND transporter permease subunit [Oceanobacillus oncorhynchi]MDM8101671.1 efflux RND transporter permease subunit [Oceanobacillus oncorhynchi]UUI41332.1 efflux RND transporter permease subunit [Oceanobacillus oncorhynchi]GIO20494.1 multidrug ABC transporter [Oceanobacillus oncorhynchi subsp. incaldanensis]